jgi:hypothetical protein
MLQMIKCLLHDRVLLFNTSAITISFMEVEQILKILLLSVSIVYTITRLYNEYRTINEKKG